MTPRRLGWLALAALVAISAALWLRGRTPGGIPTDGALIPGLAADLGSVTAVTIFKGKPEPIVSLERSGDAWTVAQRGHYPADVSKLRKLLIALGDATIRERKTRDPSNYAVLGVADARASGATGAEIDLATPQGSHAVVIGKATVGGNFARRVGEPQSVLVEPSISFETEPRFWIDPRIIDIPLGNITRLDVHPANGPAYALRRPAAPVRTATPQDTATPHAAPPPPPPPAPATGGGAEARNFELDAVPSGRKPVASALLSPSPLAFSGLTADDVSPAAGIDFSNPSKAVLTLSTGETVTITGAVVDGKHWIALASAPDAPPYAKLEGHAYELSADRYAEIFRPLEQLLEPLPVKTGAPIKPIPPLKPLKPGAPPAQPSHAP
jgi:hypothetical protein